MNPRIAAARATLQGIASAGASGGQSPALSAPGASAPRRSAVLVLFGPLDRVPASNGNRANVSPDLDLLLTRRSDSLRHHPGQIAFPGGGAEPTDDSLAQTALREAQEETGLDPAGVEVLGGLPPVHIAISGNLVTPVLGWWRLPSPVAADRTESADVFRVPVAEMLDPDARGTSVLRTRGRTFRGPAFRLGPQFGEALVWGFTGMLLADLFSRAGWGPAWDATREFPVVR